MYMWQLVKSSQGVASVVKRLEEAGAMDYTIIVAVNGPSGTHSLGLSNFFKASHLLAWGWLTKLGQETNLLLVIVVGKNHWPG